MPDGLTNVHLEVNAIGAARVLGVSLNVPLAAGYALRFCGTNPALPERRTKREREIDEFIAQTKAEVADLKNGTVGDVREAMKRIKQGKKRLNLA